MKEQNRVLYLNEKAFEDLGAKQVENFRNQLTGLEGDLKSKLSNQKFINFDNAKAQLKQFKTELTGLSGDAASAFKTLSNSTFNTFLKKSSASFIIPPQIL